MKLTFYKATNVVSKAKATIHKTGKLGFSSEAIGYLGIKEGMYISFAKDEEEKESDINIYAMLSESKNEDGFKICKAGTYYYVNTKGLFDSLNVEYTKAKIIYDFIKIEYEDMQILKMIRREISKKGKGGEDK
ncbi:MAG TPA: hypothetical protein VIK86_02315 [Candidatus Paceibacterota bacterium]